MVHSSIRICSGAGKKCLRGECLQVRRLGQTPCGAGSSSSSSKSLAAAAAAPSGTKNMDNLQTALVTSSLMGWMTQILDLYNMQSSTTTVVYFRLDTREQGSFSLQLAAYADWTSLPDTVKARHDSDQSAVSVVHRSTPPSQFLCVFDPGTQPRRI